MHPPPIPPHSLLTHANLDSSVLVGRDTSADAVADGDECTDQLPYTRLWLHRRLLRGRVLCGSGRLRFRSHRFLRVPLHVEAAYSGGAAKEESQVGTEVQPHRVQFGNG